MDSAIPGIVAGLGVAIALAIIVPRLIAGQRGKIDRMEELFRERGAMTLDEIAKELRTSVFGKGYLMQALDEMVREGKLEKTAPPPGTPALRILRETKYGPRPKD